MSLSSLSSLPPLLTLQHSSSRQVFNSLQPLSTAPSVHSLFYYLMLLLETPRPSHDCSRVQKILKAFADHHSLTYKIDKAGNVVIVRPAHPSFSSSPSICLQSHQDVVCSKTNDKIHDFNTDPVTPLYEFPWLKADRTTLGADDGAGMAATLAILSDPNVHCGPLEGLFTAEEETTMGGAEHLEKSPFLTSNIMINLDSEEPNSVCIGCAGGVEYSIKLPISRSPLPKSDDYTSLNINLHSLSGGHTGIDIHKPKPNALIIMGRLLDSIRNNDIYLLSLGGGNAPNAIPRHCNAEVYIHKEEVGEAKKKIAECYATIQKEYELVENVRANNGENDKEKDKEGKSSSPPKVWTLEIKDASLTPTDHPCDASITLKIIDILLTIPHGVLRWVIGLDGEVDLSVAFSLLSLKSQKEMAETKSDEGDFCTFHLFCRGSSTEGMEYAVKKFDSFSRLVGAVKSKPFNIFCGWTPNVKSYPLQCAIESHKELFGKTPRVYSVHAGLECGLIQANYPSMDMTSIGPLIEAAHSPDERLQVETVEPFYKWLVKIVENIQKGKK